MHMVIAKLNPSEVEFVIKIISTGMNNWTPYHSD